MDRYKELCLFIETYYYVSYFLQSKTIYIIYANISNILITYKYGVIFNSIIVVFCTMKKQRYNEILHQRIVDRLKAIRKAKGYTQEDVRFDIIAVR